METRQGKSVFSGVAIGKLFIYKKAKQVVEKSTIEDPAAEVARYMAAKAKAKEQLEMLKEKTMKDVGEAEARSSRLIRCFWRIWTSLKASQA